MATLIVTLLFNFPRFSEFALYDKNTSKYYNDSHKFPTRKQPE